MKVLMIGLGGIGQRHTRNLRALLGDSVEMIAYRVRRLTHVVTPTMGADQERNVEEVYNIRTFYSLDEALAEKPDIAMFSAGVVTQAKTVGEALASNATRMDAVV